MGPIYKLVRINLHIRAQKFRLVSCIVNLPNTGHLRLLIVIMEGMGFNNGRHGIVQISRYLEMSRILLIPTRSLSLK